MAEFSVTRSLREGVSITLSRTGAAIVGIIIVAELAEFSFNKYLGVKTPLSYIFWILDNPSRLLNHVTAGQLAYHDMFFVLIGVLLAPVPPLLILRACYSKLCQLDRLSLNSIVHRIGHTLLLSAAFAGLFLVAYAPILIGLSLPYSLLQSIVIRGSIFLLAVVFSLLYFYAVIRLILSYAAIAVDGVTVRDALRQSWDLTDGYFLKLLVTMIIASGAYELFSFLAMAAVQPGVTHLQWATSGIMNELIRLIPDVVYETVYAIPIYLRAAVLSNTFFALSLLFSLAVVSAAYAQLTDCDPQDVTDHEI